MLVKVAPDPMSMLEVSDNADQTGQASSRIDSHNTDEVINCLIISSLFCLIRSLVNDT